MHISIFCLPISNRQIKLNEKFQIFFSDIMKNCISVECTWMSVDDTIQFKDIRVIEQFELEKTFKICKYKLS